MAKAHKMDIFSNIGNFHASINYETDAQYPTKAIRTKRSVVLCFPREFTPKSPSRALRNKFRGLFVIINIVN